MNAESPLAARLRAARASLPRLVTLDAAQRDALVRAMAQSLREGADSILDANAADLAAGREAGLSDALLDRLRLDRLRLESLAEALEQIAALPDPLADSDALQTRPNGLRLRRKPAPLGVIAMVYEARPNVTAEAAALCLKAGNACVLRGGKEARRTNLALGERLRACLAGLGLPSEALLLLDDPDRSQLAELLGHDELVDVIVPRGGEALIRHVVAHSRIPVIRHYKGVCHLYVDRDAELDIAQAILIDAKTSRPGVCNALECLLVHRDHVESWLPRAAAALAARGVELRGDETALRHVPAMQPASADDWGREFLAPVLAVRVVDDLDAALDHIRRYGSRHTEAIVSRDAGACRRFVAEADASAVAVNASTRFNDGGELGLGAELGISTSKLHVYGPMGLEALTTRKWVIEGSGQVRHPDLLD
ncbi:MAG: glutamate-5-semialdehyde dehydrogenase [Lysobacteraceae bacterium]